MSNIHTISIKCPKCRGICEVKYSEYEPTIYSFKCKDCGLMGSGTDETQGGADE